MQFVCCLINLCQTRERRNRFLLWPKWNSYIKRWLKVQSPDISKLLRFARCHRHIHMCEYMCIHVIIMHAKWRDNYPNLVVETTVERTLLCFSLLFFWLEVQKASKPLILIYIGFWFISQEMTSQKGENANILLPLARSEQEHSKIMIRTCSVLDPSWEELHVALDQAPFVPKLKNEIWSKVLTLTGVGTNLRSLLESLVPFQYRWHAGRFKRH